MKLLFVNNDGGGFADYLEVESGLSVEKFFGQKMPGRRPEDYLIRVNRQPVPRDYVLQEGDRISMTPTKIEGAAKAA
jgi:sulfur carrier protein ThiS